MYNLFTNKFCNDGYLVYKCFKLDQALKIAQDLANEGYKSLIKKDGKVVARIEV